MNKIALLDQVKCDGCQRECELSCALIDVGEDGKPIIDESLCLGCGDCVEDCPKGAIRLVDEECIKGKTEETV